jgi:hypothetical protein
MNTCEKCKFWEVTEEMPCYGTCHRYPPVQDCDYVQTDACYWCGEFQPACPYVNNV